MRAPSDAAHAARQPMPSMLRYRADRGLEACQHPYNKYAMKLYVSHQQNAHEYRRIMLVTYTAICGVQVLSGLRQSMPSISIDSCARVRETVPSFACGQMKRPRSNRFANRHRLSSLDRQS